MIKKQYKTCQKADTCVNFLLERCWYCYRQDLYKPMIVDVKNNE